MLYRNLKNIGLEWYDPERSIRRLQTEFMIDAPTSVIRQFYVDHSTSSEFLEFYGDINLHEIRWSLKVLPTKMLLDIGGAATHPDYIRIISDAVKYYDTLGDTAINIVPSVAQHWKMNGTWDTPPIFLDGTRLNEPTKRYHLIEGHTRLGVCRVYTRRRSSILLIPTKYIMASFSWQDMPCSIWISHLRLILVGANRSQSGAGRPYAWRYAQVRVL